MTSLFGHLATKFATHPENLAIEALNYILARSRVANDGFVRLFGESGLDLPTDISFHTQVAGEDQARPDLEGRSGKQGTVIIIETKFWAGLTDNQPVTYLERLPEKPPAILAFIAPAARFTTLWAELVYRCGEAGKAIDEKKEVTSELWSASLNPGRHLMLLSWRTVLSEMSRALELEHEPAIASDVAQLMGLCERMDSEAFLPVRSDEITSPEIPQRYLQFEQLALDLTEAAVAEGICSKKGGLKRGNGLGYFGHYLRINDTGVFLCFDSQRWARFRSTPIWLRIHGIDFKDDGPAKEALGTLRLENPSRLIEDDGHAWVPMLIPTGVEHSEVISCVVAQLREIKDHLDIAELGGEPGEI